MQPFSGSLKIVFKGMPLSIILGTFYIFSTTPFNPTKCDKNFSPLILLLQPVPKITTKITVIGQLSRNSEFLFSNTKVYEYDEEYEF